MFGGEKKTAVVIKERKAKLILAKRKGKGWFFKSGSKEKQGKRKGGVTRYQEKEEERESTA